MQNCPYNLIIAERPLHATREEYEALKATLKFGPKDLRPNGWDVGYIEGKVYIVAQTGYRWKQLTPKAFNDLAGILIAKNGLDHLDFRGGRPAPLVIESSPTYFRIMDNGSLWRPARNR